MREWLISVPVWGVHYLDVFTNYAAPALRAALSGFPEPFRFVVHTDNPDRIRKSLDGLPVELRAVPPRATYVALQNAHGEVITDTPVGGVAVLLNADLVVSGNLFLRCLEHVASGSRAVVLAGVRTFPDEDAPLVGVGPRELLEWAWAHRHRIIRDLEWGTGSSMLPTNLFFTSGKNTILHGFHLHPVAVVKERAFSFNSTIDGDLLDHYDRATIHVVTDPDDLSMLEISPPGKRFPVRENRILSPALVAGAMQSRASEMHRWLFTKKIVLRGSGDEVDARGIVDEILSIMNRRH